MWICHCRLKTGEALSPALINLYTCLFPNSFEEAAWPKDFLVFQQQYTISFKINFSIFLTSTPANPEKQ
jgi:hypothetical protein